MGYFIIEKPFRSIV